MTREVLQCEHYAKLYIYFQEYAYLLSKKNLPVNFMHDSLYCYYTHATMRHMEILWQLTCQALKLIKLKPDSYCLEKWYEHTESYRREKQGLGAERWVRGCWVDISVS